MNFRTTLLACASAIALLTACGGSSSSSSGDDNGSSAGEPADRYAGSWRSECLEGYAAGENPAYPNGQSQFIGIVFVKADANSMTFTHNVAEYETANCSGPRTALFTSRGTVSLDGGKQVGNVQTDRATFTTTNGPASIGKVLLWVNDGRLYQGTQAPRDAQGYPNQLETNDPWSAV